MRVQLLVLVPDPYYFKRAASSSNSMNLENDAWLKPDFVTALARQMKLRCSAGAHS